MRNGTSTFVARRAVAVMLASFALPVLAASPFGPWPVHPQLVPMARSYFVIYACAAVALVVAVLAAAAWNAVAARREHRAAPHHR